MKYDLSILIPARNEQFLARTVEDILANIEGNTEIIVVLDGAWADPGLPQHPRLTVVYHPVSVGQRAATNEACRLSNAKYVVKTDAHCAFDKGFDVKMMSRMQDDWTMIPVMKNLHAFDWLCPNGHRRYQGAEGPCKECGEPTKQDIVWIAKDSPKSVAYRFDKDLHFQYWNEYGHKQKGDITETMSIQGSFFMMTRAKYLELNICDEEYGSWGQQGVEVACKTWLSGGRVVVCRDTWYAHLFRTQPGFGFPYPQSGSAQERARTISKDIWFNNKWPLAIHKFQWLIDKFMPIPGWEKITKGILYYTDNRLDERIMKKCQEQLMKLESSELPIVSVSLKDIQFGVNYVLPAERGYLTMAKQILLGLEMLNTDLVFFCEHDVLYHPSHFDFIPPKKDVYYYNTNVWKVRDEDGHAMRVDDCRQLSGLCANRELLIKHYKERIRRIEAEGFSRKMGFEPGTHNRKERVDDFRSDRYESAFPNIDIRHKENLTSTRWSPDQFRDQRFTKGWQESDEIPGWGKYKDFMK